jgi:putative addiction module component (TIGR02574 family)
MIYTIKIDDSSKQAQSIINLLNALAKDYDFLEIIEEEEFELTPEQEAELERRYELFLKDPNKGKSWEEVKANL